jgi:heme/copper-type cytochrome/quinol oxidase subunit 2
MRWITTAFVFAITLAASALAQNAPPPAEVQGEPISTLMLFTLIGGLLIAIGLFAWFLRRRSNRAAADRALNPNNPANR